MKIAIVGCGAMGSIYAALLADAGHEVIAVDKNREHVAAINQNGLRVLGASGDRTVHIRAYVSVPEENVDLVVCAVKARFVEDAAGNLGPLLGPNTQVLTIQNGLGSAELLAKAIGQERLIVGVAQGFGASLPEPGCAHHNDMKAIRMGNFHATPERRRALASIAELWQQAGFDAAPVDDIVAMQWEKLICNVAYSAPCALTGLTVGAVMTQDHISTVSQQAACEAFAVARALDIHLNFHDPIQHVQDFAARMLDAKPSVLLDLEAGRPSEVDVINGAIPKEASKVNMPAPVNATLTALVRTLEANAADSAITR